MIRFTKLRISGFKSFAEPVDIHIEPGLTGVVGPNGCGKSNLVEALRWAMGETSARQMRGSEMDDVIFGGSANRPPRNLAEVVLFLDNRDRTAPARFNDSDDLEISRRIDRGQGSGYRINGRDVRARDVQTLFSDVASGARSTALVSQGRVSGLIAAKPSERRTLLEEAAGIGGLHARRHEASQKLKAAETNLERLADILGTLGGQLQTLKRQARQAMRYRELSEKITRTEIALFVRQWTMTLRALDDAHAALMHSDAVVAQTAANVARLTVLQEEADAALPALRHSEVDASAVLQRLHVAREQLLSEETRLDEMLVEQRRRCEQGAQDLERENTRLNDAMEEIARLRDERAALEHEREGEAGERRQLEAGLGDARADVERREAELGALLEQVAAADAERAALMRRLTESEARTRRLTERERDINQQIRRTEDEQVDQTDITSAEMELEAAQEYLEESRLRIEDIETQRQDIMARNETARETLLTLETSVARLAAERDALEAVLADTASETAQAQPPILDDIVPQPGFETAVGAAIGDDLSAPHGGDAAIRWVDLPPLDAPPPLPSETIPLLSCVTAPTVLARRLSQIGLVASLDAGSTLHGQLLPGQRLVSREGDVWRWDGLVRSADAPSPVAARLQHRARYREISLHLEDAEQGLLDARPAVDRLRDEMQRLTDEEKQVRTSLREGEAETGQAQAALARLQQKAAEVASRLATLKDTHDGLLLDLEETRGEEEEARLLLADRDEGGSAREQLARLRAESAEARTVLSEAQAACDRLDHAIAARTQRGKAIDASLAQWQERLGSGQRHRDDLEKRLGEAHAELERLTALPEEIDARRDALLEELDKAEEKRTEAALALEKAEQKAAEAARQLKAEEQKAAEAREEKIRREAEVAACAQNGQTLAARIMERLSCTPEQLMQRADTEVSEDPSTPEELEATLSRLQRDRDALGAVNLLAEREVAELEEQIGTLNAERDDLIAAIERLNRAIAELNREGRQRLLAAFEKVDTQFRSLFTRLFGGGRAHLSLIDSTDPLGAGLEIIASPPGKRLQILSLLSGGEQALTALALLFAVFLVNPAPICVLDEVDAPLDDANVDRFCSLVTEIAATSQTRFLIITHHRMTMARMDRLFGVTMVERGISQVVSVDLDEAESFSEMAAIA